MADVWTLRSKSGESRPGDDPGNCARRRGKRRNCRVSILDITEHRKPESALSEREQRYGELLAAVTNYTYSVNLENGVPVSTEHSWGCLAVTGYTPEDYKSDPYLWIHMVHPDDREMVRQYVAEVIGGEKRRPSSIELFAVTGPCAGCGIRSWLTMTATC